jgi:5-methylcytosine-specific restriction endonuclease McrA
MKQFNLRTFLVSQLRRASYRHPTRNEVLKDARIDRGLYKCASCNGIFDRSSVQIDHIEPVIKLEGWDSWDGFIERLFCGKEGQQCVCKGCHKSKTFLENELRKQYKIGFNEEDN